MFWVKSKRKTQQPRLSGIILIWPHFDVNCLSSVSCGTKLQQTSSICGYDYTSRKINLKLRHVSANFPSILKNLPSIFWCGIIYLRGNAAFLGFCGAYSIQPYQNSYQNEIEKQRNRAVLDKSTALLKPLKTLRFQGFFFCPFWNTISPKSAYPQIIYTPIGRLPYHLLRQLPK